MCEPCACLPAEGRTDRLQSDDQPLSFTGTGGDELWHALGEDAASAGQILAHAFAHRELDAGQARSPKGGPSGGVGSGWRG